MTTEGAEEQEVDEVAAVPTAHLVVPEAPRSMFSPMDELGGLLVVERHVLD